MVNLTIKLYQCKRMNKESKKVHQANAGNVVNVKGKCLDSHPEIQVAGVTMVQVEVLDCGHVVDILSSAINLPVEEGRMYN